MEKYLKSFDRFINEFAEKKLTLCLLGERKEKQRNETYTHLDVENRKTICIFQKIEKIQNIELLIFVSLTS